MFDQENGPTHLRFMVSRRTEISRWMNNIESDVTVTLVLIILNTTQEFFPPCTSPGRITKKITAFIHEIRPNVFLGSTEKAEVFRMMIGQLRTLLTSTVGCSVAISTCVVRRTNFRCCTRNLYCARKSRMTFEHIIYLQSISCTDQTK